MSVAILDQGRLMVEVQNTAWWHFPVTMSANDRHKPCGMFASTADRLPDQCREGGGKKTASHRDVAGRHLHFLQIGLGTNTTFVQNIAGQFSDWSYNVDWLLQAASERRGHSVRGVGVEP